MQIKLSEEITQNKQNLSEVISSIKSLESHVQSMKKMLNQMQKKTDEMPVSNGNSFARLNESKDKPGEIVSEFTFWLDLLA